MTRPTLPLRAGAAVLLLVLGACADRLSTAPERPDEPVRAQNVAEVVCRGDVSTGTVTCGPPSTPGGPQLIILGGQGLYVKLANTTPVVTPPNSGGPGGARGRFAFDVTVQNLLGQPLNTTDGSTASTEGVRVFFHKGPTTTGGTGIVDVQNEDGNAAFISAAAPFFRYGGAAAGAVSGTELGPDGILVNEETSSPRSWVLEYDATVTTFSFAVYVSAPVREEDALSKVGIDPETVVAAIGGGQSCGLTPSGQAFCWGNNTSGQLGDSSVTSLRTTPVAVKTARRFRTLAAGGSHTCGVTVGGAVLCWGAAANGQLGNGTTTPTQTAPVAVLAPASGAVTWASISAGGSHTCGVTTAGAAFCWGNVLNGRLGNVNATTDQTTPSPVSDPASGAVTWARVSAGSSHTCGTTTAGAAFCWGNAANARLGNGTTTPDQTTPSPVSAPASGAVTWASISAGVGHTCGVTTAGAAFCWGAASSGRLGNGTTTPDQTTPSPVAAPASGAVTWARVSAGSSHTCGVTTAGAAFCWGGAANGKLGNGTTTPNQTTPSPVSDPAGGAVTWARVSAGGAHTCGVTTAGAAFCWGGALNGRLGNGDATTDQTTPSAVSTTSPAPATYATGQ